ncbi:8499_t:CDS:2 [Dentiscutata erythropus]|uniref:8499_t:CDS:1 n=1 Tax=Dentiscutata erythropus TaxID=1348616 RepID=A0A9N9GV78_9GLOM|nr:8499_t:CDS:2 [Dentiscutata erythropus]
MTRKINDKGFDLIKKFEGFRGDYYTDPVGYKTIGYGHACHANDCSNITPPLTEAQGEELLREDLVKFEESVESLSPGLNSNQFSALVSFTFNLGSNAYKNSTLLTKIKSGDLEGASEEFGKWVYAGGKKSNGLVKRREAERELFLQDV